LDWLELPKPSIPGHGSCGGPSFFGSAYEHISSFTERVKHLMLRVAGGIEPCLAVALDNFGLLIRPYLFLVGAHSAEQDVKWVSLDLLVGIELIQQSTLLFDDILDRAPLRNERRSLWSEVGTGKAVCLSEQVRSRGELLVAEGIAGKRGGSSALGELLTGVEVLYRGQLIDVSTEPFSVPTLDGYRDTIRLTTERFLEASLVSGAYAGGATDDTIDRLRGWAIPWGEAYQIRDDILDYIGTEDFTGKAPYRDLKEGKLRLPAMVCLERLSGEEQEDFLRQARDYSAGHEGSLNATLGYLRKTGSITESARRVADLCQESCSHLGPPLPPAVSYTLAAIAAMVGYFTIPASYCEG
jgi:octaprenyl-diphosphate synthase